MDDVSTEAVVVKVELYQGATRQLTANFEDKVWSIGCLYHQPSHR